MIKTQPYMLLAVVYDYHDFQRMTEDIINLDLEHLELGTESSGAHLKYVGVIFEKGNTPTDKDVSKLISNADIKLDEE